MDHSEGRSNLTHSPTSNFVQGSSRALDASSVGAAKLAVSAAVLALGFRAVSDDDYARLVIAQRFAESPSLDPSGTSWLPLPFWLYGAAFRLFGHDLAVARGVALLLGALSAIAVWWAARLFGAGRAGAIAAGILAAVSPWSAWLGAAPLPEAPTAGLLVVALVTLPLESPRLRTAGALAVAAACFCRYEAWPVAVTVAGFALADARRTHSRQLLAVVALALAPIALWLAHGAVRHGDALFFVRRVAAYRQALGDGEPVVLRILGPLRSLFFGAPEVMLPLLLGVAKSGIPASFRRPLAGAAALLVFLMLGEAGGGGPTHHAERALLPLWFLAAALLAKLAERWSRARTGLLGLVVLGALLLLGVRGPYLPDFADRKDALAIGKRARELGAPALLVDTPDYAHLAVTAAYGHPSRSAPLDDHDPRRPRPPDAFASRAALAERLGAAPSAWLVVTRAHAPVALALGTERAANASFLLVTPRAAPRQ
jgi:hypothetical protein